MIAKIISLLIGYLFGSFLTAELVARRFAGKQASELGDTGNPGMANIMASLGFVPGIITLAGDLIKCIAAVGLAHLIFQNSGRIITLYAGLGCTLGHDFPFWRKFRGGKGVATTSMAIGLYDFWPALGANIIGLIVVCLTKYLCIGGPFIPLSFLVWTLIQGESEAAGIMAVLTVLSVLRHGSSIMGIKKGTTKQTDLIGHLRKRRR